MKEFDVIVEFNDGEEAVFPVSASTEAEAIQKASDFYVGYQVADIFVEG